MRLSLSLALLGLAAGPAVAADRPNLVFLFADDQRHDALGCVQKEQGDKGRFPWFQTPSMDRLAAEGVRFRNAFVVNSLCSPSRACYLTGRYSHANGIYNNRTPFPADAVTHASLLRQAGYATAYVGKWHMGSQADRPGFDWVASFTGQSVYTDAPFLVNGTSEKAPDWTDDRSAGYAVRFLEKDRPKDKPFLLVVGFKAPHGPFAPPDRLKEKFAGAKARAVPNLGVAPAFNPDLGKNVKPPAGDEVDVNLNYYRCIAGVDENVGKILDALDRLKLADDTVVVYSSDNGFYQGEHGLADKRSGYDESLRIPFLVRYPKAAEKGGVRDDMVLNIDLAPTLLDFAGVAIPKEMHGKSWKRLLPATKAREAFRSSFFYEYYRENGGAAGPGTNPGGYNTPTMTAVRTPTHKLLRYADNADWTEVFDLVADPFETKNLARDPAHADLRKKLEAEHDRLAKELAYVVPADVPKTAAPARPAPAAGWVLDYDFTKDAGEQVRDASGAGSHGTAKNAALVEGRDKAKAREFKGDGVIEVTRTEGLNCAGVPFTVEVTLKAEGKGGVILARGGATNGFALFLKDGVPTFAVRNAGTATTANGKGPVVGKWVKLTASLDGDGKMTLAVDEAVVGEAKAGLIPREPNDGMQVGADLASPVDADAAKEKFAGRIERVRVHRGPLAGR